MRTCCNVWLILPVTILAASVVLTQATPLVRAAGPWYVAAGGSDSNSCASPAAPCATLNGAIVKAASGDHIYVAVGTYTGTGTEVVLINKNVTLSGGWNSTFTTQNGISTIDAQHARRCVSVGDGLTVMIERFTIQGGYPVPDICSGIWSGGILTLSNSTVTRIMGCGICNNSVGNLTLNQSTVSDNTDCGINNNGPMVTLNNSTISGNQGGINSIEARGGIVNLNNSTVSGNHAYRGGGIYAESTTVRLYNSTISNNVAENAGGGIYGWNANTTTTLQDSIIAGNTTVSGNWPDCAGEITSAGYNLISKTSGCLFAAATGDLTDVDAHLGPLVGAPGTPKYHILLTGSPAIDAGNPAGCSGSDGPLTTDQRGAARAGRCDIGAYEYTTPGPAASVYALAGTPQHAPPLNPFFARLQALVLDSLGSPVKDVNVTFSAPVSEPSGIFADTGTYTTTALTAESGVVTATTFTAGAVMGSYVVSATVSGVLTPATFSLTNGGWYVAPSGDDNHDCVTPATACASINHVLTRPDFSAGETIYVAIGTYTGTGDQVVLLDKNAALSGGWDSDFTTQEGTSTVDGQHTRRGVAVNKGASASIERVTIRDGNSPYWGGGGILNRGSLTLNNCNISDYTDTGIYNDHSTLTLSNSIVKGNLAPSSDSGIMNDSGIVTLNNSTVSNSVTGDRGGGICNYLKSTLILNNSTVSGNIGGSGGGIWNYYSTVILNNSTVSGNTASHGGGIFVDSGDIAPSTVTLNNTILAGNTAGDGPECSGTMSSVGYSLIADTAGCTFTPGTGDLANINARLGALVGAPGVPNYHPLLSGSPAINAGNPAGCTGSTGLLTADQRGVARVGRCDIGAYEYTAPGQAALVYAFAGTPQRTSPLRAFGAPLQAAVLDSIGTPANGAMVTLTAPVSGPSGIFADTGTRTTSTPTAENGLATAPTFTANGLTGNYTVTATVSGLASRADFSLSNNWLYVTPSGDDEDSCTSPVEACATINGVLKKANPGELIFVASGTYVGTDEVSVAVLNKDTTLSGGWNSDFTTQDGTSTVDGQGGPRQGIVVNNGVSAVIERFTVQGANVGWNGSGITNGGVLTLNHCVVRDNSVFDVGGGIYNSGTLTLNGSIVAGNKAELRGGGIYNVGSLALNNSTVSGSRGDGIRNVSNSSSTLNNTIVSGNSSRGIANDLGVLTVAYSTISGNTAGGVSNSGILTMNYSSIAGNTTSNVGGGIINGGTLSLYGSAVNDNTAYDPGGGIYNGGTLILNNSTVSGNKTTNTPNGFGGGIYNCSGTLTLNNVTIRGNTSDLGGGIFDGSSGSVMLKNAIVAGNRAGRGGPECSGSIGSAGYNLIGDTSGCDFASGIGDLTNIDPKLGPLQGSPGYHPLLPGSPAINAGNPAGCSDEVGNPLNTDQRGLPRFGRCDIGACEMQPIGSSDKAVNRLAASPGEVVTYTITLANGGGIQLIDVWVTDTLPISLTYVDNSLSATAGSFGYNQSVITWTGPINAGGAVTLTFGATISQTIPWGTTLTNSAVISGGGEIVTRTASTHITGRFIYLPVVLKHQ